MWLQLTWQGWFTIAIVAATLALLSWERLKPHWLLAGATAALILSGVLTPAQALAGFWNPGVLTIALLFVLVAALRGTGAIRWVGDWVLGRNHGEAWMRARLVAISSGLSAFINNTPVVAMLTSAVEQRSRRGGPAASTLLLPMNYATILGGMCTLVGTSTNLIVAGLVATRPELPALSMFAPLSVALPAVLVGGLYLVFAARWLLPVRRGALDQAAETREYVVEMRVATDGPLPGRSIDAAGLRHLADSFLVELGRGEEILAAVAPEIVLQGGDRLVFVGAGDAVRELRDIAGLEPALEPAFNLAPGQSSRQLVELVLSRFSPVIGLRLRDAGFRGRYHAAVIALSQHGERRRGKLGDVQLQAGDTLLVEAGPEFLDAYRNSSEFLLVNPLDSATRIAPRRATLVLTLLVGMIAGNALFGFDLLISALVAASLALVTGCVGLRELRRSFDLRLLIVVACSFAFGAAMERSGVAALAAAGLNGLVGADPFLALVAIYVAAVLFTEFLTNNAAAVLMFPLGLSVAAELGVSPMPFVIALMIGASAGFMTPIGYQTNLMVYGPGGYRFTDYVRIGAPLSLVVGIAVLWSIPRVFPF
jgi:di/tricarboxylate transporter